ncbi:S-layer family protein, partial [Ralstonia solanacearum]|nr:S-layer family protein [Ralstonia solanacearum]
TRDVDEAHQFKGSSSWFSKKTITTRNTLSETTTQGTTFSGNTTYVQAGNDINVKGSNVVSTEGTMNPEVLWLSGKGSQGSPAAR